MTQSVRKKETTWQATWTVFSAAECMFQKPGLQSWPYSLSRLNPSQSMFLESHFGCWRIDAVWMSLWVRNTNKLSCFLGSLFDLQVIKNIKGTRNASQSKLHWGVTILDVFRGCWALKGGEENQLLHLMTDVIRLIHSGGVRNGKEGERAVGRRTWPHLRSPEKCSAHNVVPCLLPSPVAALLLQPWPSLGVQLCSCHPSFLRKILPPPL